jgi:long-chain acyl-CoA synthetase
LAEFQRISRWELWPEPDLPRTSTGKVRRKAVARWLAKKNGTAGKNGSLNGATHANGASKNGNGDWLLALIAQITDEALPAAGDELRFTEDLHLDSLGRVQLAAAIEERIGLAAESGLLEEVQTLGELRHLVAGNHTSSAGTSGLDSETAESRKRHTPGAPYSPNPVAKTVGSGNTQPAAVPKEPQTAPPPAKYIYPAWPWWLPFRWLRAVFVEGAMRPLIWLLAKPAVVASGKLSATEPMLIVANHVTSFDGPLLEYALPGPIRRRIAVAMSGEMLEEYRHFRNAEQRTIKANFYPPGPLIYLLLTALFNVFPLPKQRDFQRSFAHAGNALDRGFHVLLFPEGTRSAEGEFARFRPGIGLLVKQSGAPVLPMAIRGLGELKTGSRAWFRSGSIEVRVGQPIRFGPLDSEAAITARLHAEVEKLLKNS